MKRLRLALVLLLAGCGGPTPPAARPPYEARCPADLATPATTRAPDLPDTTAVGRGAFVYRTCAECDANLLTESGRVYRLPPITVVTSGPSPTSTLDPGPQPLTIDPMYGVRLSPDGRYLVRPGRPTVVRDLTSGRQTGYDDLTATMPPWSDDGRWIATADHIVDLDEGVSFAWTRPAAYRDWDVVAVLDAHEVLLRDDARQRFANYVGVDPVSGAVVTSYPRNVVALDGRWTVWTTRAEDQPPTVAVLADLDSGAIVARYPLPTDEPRKFSFWTAGRVGESAILVHNRAFSVDGGPTIQADPVELFTLDRATGARELTCTLPPRTEIVLPH